MDAIGVFCKENTSQGLTIAIFWVRMNDSNEQTTLIDLYGVEVRIRDSMCRIVSPIRERIHNGRRQGKPTEIPPMCSEFTFVIENTALPEKARHSLSKLIARRSMRLLSAGVYRLDRQVLTLLISISYK